MSRTDRYPHSLPGSVKTESARAGLRGCPLTSRRQLALQIASFSYFIENEHNHALVVLFLAPGFSQKARNSLKRQMYASHQDCPGDNRRSSCLLTLFGFFSKASPPVKYCKGRGTHCIRYLHRSHLLLISSHGRPCCFMISSSARLKESIRVMKSLLS